MHAHFNNLYFNQCHGGTRACAFHLQDYGCLFDSHYGPLVHHSLKRVSGCSSEIKVPFRHFVSSQKKCTFNLWECFGMKSCSIPWNIAVSWDMSHTVASIKMGVINKVSTYSAAKSSCQFSNPDLISGRLQIRNDPYHTSHYLFAMMHFIAILIAEI